ILLFITQIVKKYEIKIPLEFEWFLLIFAVITLFLGKTGGVITSIVFGIAIAMVGFMILAILYSSNQIKKNYFLIIMFSFNFAVAFGCAIELAKYYLKILFNQALSQDIYAYSMQTLTFVVLGALISSIIGYIYMRYHFKIIGGLVGKMIEKNPKLFKKSEALKEEVFELIKKGESENLEFKSTFRTNLHTDEIDRKIEYSTLKTLVAFMNSKRGTLLIGISDSGEIIGTEKDKFESKDNYALHFTNIIKTKIGKKYLPLVNLQFIEIDGKTLLKIDCEKSKDPVFIKSPTDEEEFYIRVGPSSVQVKGSELVEYIEKNFKKKD
ncbi:MAG: ATP-binding protein, partial [Candidatus Pacearchaeota archaeon]|nr:ATP-binding protein [Candidatus Pacearchaeota archaeon]